VTRKIPPSPQQPPPWFNAIKDVHRIVRRYLNDVPEVNISNDVAIHCRISPIDDNIYKTDNYCKNVVENNDVPIRTNNNYGMHQKQ